MDNYLVSARKYRPATFKSVVGQKALTATLKNAIATGRLAHSYLFCGSRGVGKTSCARIMAKTINCQNPTPDGEACNECESCRAFNAGTSLNIIELDAASNNGVEDIRQLTDQVQVPPVDGRYRVFIIDEVHMLSSAAFNAFLKTLEEPPSYVVFILATTEKHKILPTILSRCQIYDFNRITIQDMIDHLGYVASQEGITAETAALNIIARKADGAMRDALSIFDQVAASTRGNITYHATLDNLNVLDYEYYNRLLECFLAGDILKAWMIYKEIRERGFDSQFFINGLAGYFRDLMVARDPATVTLLEAGDEARQAMAQWGAKCDPSFLYKAMDLCNDADLNYRVASNKQFLVELTLAKICQLQSPFPNNSGEGKGQLKKIAAKTSPSPATPSQSVPPASTTPGPRQATTTTPTAATPAAAAPQPVATPRYTAPTPPAGGVHSGRAPRLSLRGINKDNAAAAETRQQEAAPKAETPYTDNDLRRAWNEYADARPTEHILVNTMRASLPAMKGENLYEITVENERQLSLMNERMPQILAHIHKALRNDMVQITVAVNRGEASPITWNEREVLKHMVETTPYMRTFIEDFGLNLS